MSLAVTLGCACTSVAAAGVIVVACDAAAAAGSVVSATGCAGIAWVATAGRELFTVAVAVVAATVAVCGVWVGDCVGEVEEEAFADVDNAALAAAGVGGVAAGAGENEAKEEEEEEEEDNRSRADVSCKGSFQNSLNSFRRALAAG